MSWNPHSPSHSNLHGGAETTGEPLDIFREKYYYRYLCYLRYFDFQEITMRMFGIFWALLILMLNTGSDIDRKRSKWYSDSNSLTTCLNVTFCIVVILIAI